MFVSESNLFNSPSIRIRVCGLDIIDVVLEVTPDLTIDKIKLMAITNLFDPNEASKLAVSHRMMNIRTGKTLNEEKTSAQEGLQDNDEILLLKKRPVIPVLDAGKKDDSRIGPSVDDVNEATKNVPAKNHERCISNDTNDVNFQSELKKILISLIDSAVKIACLSPQAEKIFKEAEEYMEEKNSGPKVNPDKLKQITDMGFSNIRAYKALRSTRNSTTEAVQWLFEHENDDDIDDTIPGLMESSFDSELPNLKENEHQEPLESDASSDKILKMLDSFKRSRKREFKPNQRALRNLMELGFDEIDARNALRATSNGENAACEWLLSENREIIPQDSETGLDTESTLYKSIMSNPVVQLGLNNPRSLIAFLHMLQNPGNIQQWLNDPDTGPMLIQISKIYHAEKHAENFSHSSINMYANLT